MKSKVKSQKSKAGWFIILDPGARGEELCFALVRMGEERVEQWIMIPRGKAIEELFAAVEQQLRRRGLEIHDIKGVGIMSGGESFSTVRGVFAIANALAWGLGIPGLVVTKPQSHTAIMSILAELMQRKEFQLLVPQYSREPNITSR